MPGRCRRSTASAPVRRRGHRTPVPTRPHRGMRRRTAWRRAFARRVVQDAGPCGTPDFHRQLRAYGLPVPSAPHRVVPYDRTPTRPVRPWRGRYDRRPSAAPRAGTVAGACAVLCRTTPPWRGEARPRPSGTLVGAPQGGEPTAGAARLRATDAGGSPCRGRPCHGSVGTATRAGAPIGPFCPVCSYQCAYLSLRGVTRATQKWA